MIPKRPLRSVWLGNPRYLSVYGLGVAQAMGLRGDWHRTVSIFDEPGDIARQVDEMAPDVIWTHAIAWPPSGAAPAAALCSIAAKWKRRGSAVFLHDGDPRERNTGDLDIAGTFTHALVNRSVDCEPWPVPCLRWPYAAMVQREIAPAREEWRCDLLFAGHMRPGEPLYGDRTQLVNALHRALGPRMRIVSPGGGDVNNRMQVADVAPSAGAVLGFARPEVPGWIDTRVFQYPGAGGCLIHDDAGEFLEPDVHYLKFDRAPNAQLDSILAAVERAKTDGWKIREQGFAHVQRHHTWMNRLEQALAAFYGGG